jgi:hypothetical protein
VQSRKGEWELQMMKSYHLYWTTAAGVFRGAMLSIQVGERSTARVDAEMGG